MAKLKVIETERCPESHYSQAIKFPKGEHRDKWQVRCVWCAWAGPIEKTKDEAILAWNKWRSRGKSLS